jgi:hypothetical protein
VFRHSSNQNLDVHNEILVKLTAVSLSSSEHYQKHDIPGHDYLNLNNLAGRHRYWTDFGIAWAGNLNVQDIDDTAMGFRLLRLHGFDVSEGTYGITRSLITRLRVRYNQEDLPAVPLHCVMISPLKFYQQVTLNASNTSLTELNS